jgi:hypothetical protein
MYTNNDIEKFVLGQMSREEETSFRLRIQEEEALRDSVRNYAESLLEELSESKILDGEYLTDAIDRYLNKDMSPEEDKEFESLVSADIRFSYALKLHKLLRKEVRLNSALLFLKEKEQFYQREQGRPAAALMGDNHKTIKEGPDGKMNDKVLNFRKYIKTFTAVAVAACMVGGVFIWDHSVTVGLGDELLDNYRSGIRGDRNALEQYIYDGDYDAALKLIDEELGVNVCYYVSPDVDAEIDPEAAEARKQEIDNLNFTKAMILLKEGNKSKAKKILKDLDNERSREVLDKLLW